MNTAPKPYLNNREQAERIASFQEVVVAGLRAKQLLRGSKPRIQPEPGKRKYTSIAVEEVRRGLISFTQTQQPKTARDAGETIPITAFEHDAFSSFNTGGGP